MTQQQFDPNQLRQIMGEDLSNHFNIGTGNLNTGRLGASDGLNNFRPPSLEELFGANQARQAEFGNYLNQNVSGINGNYRDFLDRQVGATNRLMQLNDLLATNASPTFTAFLNNRLGGFNQATANTNQLNTAAEMLRAGQNGGFSPSQNLAIDNLSSNPRGQFDMVLDYQLANLPSRFHAAGRSAGDRQYDSILAQQGLDPNFNFLPFLQQRGFNVFGF